MDCSRPCSCPSLYPGVCSDSSPLNPWCHLTISSSADPFSFCLQFSPASGFFFSPMSQFFASGGQSWRSSSSHSPSNECSGLMSFWIDWFNFLADQDGDRSLPPGEITCKWGSERLFLPFVVMKEIGLYHPQWVKVSRKQHETWIKQATSSSSSSGLENSYLNRLN